MFKNQLVPAISICAAIVSACLAFIALRHLERLERLSGRLEDRTFHQASRWDEGATEPLPLIGGPSRSRHTNPEAAFRYEVGDRLNVFVAEDVRSLRQADQIKWNTQDASALVRGSTYEARRFLENIGVEGGRVKAVQGLFQLYEREIVAVIVDFTLESDPSQRRRRADLAAALQHELLDLLRGVLLPDEVAGLETIWPLVKLNSDGSIEAQGYMVLESEQDE